MRAGDLRISFKLKGAILLFQFFLVLTLLLWVASAGGIEESEAQRYERRVQAWERALQGLEYRADEILVDFGDISGSHRFEETLLKGLEIVEVFRYRPVALFKIVSGERLAQALARIESVPGVRKVSPNLIRRCAFIPNDPMYTSQKYHIPIRSPMAWDVTTGSSSVKVAVIDTGLDVNHPEFAGRVVWKENFFDGDKVGNDNVFDDTGHGTAVTGLIAAQGNNGVGIAGMAWDVRIMAFRACGGAQLECSISDEIQAIDSAVAHGADVINLSLGGKGTNSFEAEAVRDAYDAGVVLVAAAGNGNPDGKLFVSTGDPVKDMAELYYPAGFPEVVGVAALDNKGGSILEPSLLTRASFSNYGEAIVSVSAVGTGVLTTVPSCPKENVPYPIYANVGYSHLTGTSFACPQVAGLAALIISRFPDLKPAEVVAQIELRAYPMGGPDTNNNGIDDYMGNGIIDASASLGTPVTNSVFENAHFRVGVSRSPLFSNDVYVLVYCKIGINGKPRVSYFVKANAENAEVEMEPLPAQPNMFLGRFHTLSSGQVTFIVTGLMEGSSFPLQTLSFTCVL